MHFRLLLLCLLLVSCSEARSDKEAATIKETKPAEEDRTFLVVLGTIQDAGSPQIGCEKECCKGLFDSPDPDRQVVSLGLYDAATGRRYLFEATPDMPRQMKALSRYGKKYGGEVADGIFLTHAHIGHYTGLMYLGKEAMDAQNVSVYTMPKMSTFLSASGPWDQLVIRNNIALEVMKEEQGVRLSDGITVTPYLVPHRDEYSETVGYHIQGPAKSALFIPDIDKWEKWGKDILEEIKKADYAFLDATFYSGRELNNRDMSEIPHPFILESLEKFASLSSEDRGKVIFIHFNHTNPVIDPKSQEARAVIQKGFNIATNGDVYSLQ